MNNCFVSLQIFSVMNTHNRKKVLNSRFFRHYSVHCVQKPLTKNQTMSFINSNQLQEFIQKWINNPNLFTVWLLQILLDWNWFLLRIELNCGIYSDLNDGHKWRIIILIKINIYKSMNETLLNISVI